MPQGARWKAHFHLRAWVGDNENQRLRALQTPAANAEEPLWNSLFTMFKEVDHLAGRSSGAGSTARMGLLGCSKSVDVDDERAMQRAARLPLRKRIGRSLARRRSEKVAPALPQAVSVSERTLIMLGCDGAGKSTLVAAMRGGDVSKVTTTVGFDPHKCVLDGAPLRLFDVGGGEKIRGIWKCYYMEVHAAVFVVDASDPARFDEARALLHEAYATETLAGKPLLIIANKATLPQAAAEAAVAEGLRLSELPAGAPYHVCAGSASVETGDALFRDEARSSAAGPHGGLTW